MEDWLYYSLSIIFVCLALFLLSSLRPAKPSLPPGPTGLSVFGPLLLFVWTNFGIEPIIRAARSWYGPVFTLYLLPSSPVIVIADRAVAHRVLVRSGAAFDDRPPANIVTRIFSSDQHSITAGAYGPLWRVLRRNLTSKVLHPSCHRRYAAARQGAVSGLIAGIKRQMSGDAVVVIEGLLHDAIFHVFVSICFGEALGDGVIAAVTALQREFLTSVVGFQVFGTWPAVTKYVFRRQWKRMLSIRRRQEELFTPLIRARKARREAAGDNFAVDSYVDSLLGLRIPEDGGRDLMESEMVSLCSEFLSGGTDSTVAAMQWTMANLVAQPEIQAKLRADIHHVAGAGAGIQEEHLPRMPYLRAVVLEGLRRHPPGHLMVPHAATEGGATLDGFCVPRHAPVTFTVASIAMDEAVWPDARRFRPERFLPGGEAEDVDLTGSKEIKMMPFGAGRRICPGMALGLLHLEYFVANLVREFEWTEVPGEPVQFAERQEMSVVMRRPLRAKVVPCMHK
ncbi:cytochrome P450 89A2-like [Phragmites australis]|uniref:cytochrome P450 89A2-like n=1 Tax=Phragmites australis TaxID=29695 RepID=UPI002D78E852|nr:cytochrome P450 89A2-like [Phragmites australis]